MATDEQLAEIFGESGGWLAGEPVAPEADLLEEILAAHERATKHVFESRYADEQELAPILLARGGLVDELARAKANAKALVEGRQGALAAFDWKFKERAMRLAQSILERQKGKTVKLVTGKCGFRRSPVKVVVIDESKLPEEFVRIKREPNLAKIKASGECPPGCAIVDGEDQFFMGG